MRRKRHAGFTLVEMLVAMLIASITGTLLLQLVIDFQSHIFTEISRNDLQDRANRLIRFVASDIRSSAFGVGATPSMADGMVPSLTRDSLPGDPQELLSAAIIARDTDDDQDRITLVKAVSFLPPLKLVEQSDRAEDLVQLNRRPNRFPGSSREIQSYPEAINLLVFAGQAEIYTAQEIGQTLRLQQPLRSTVLKDTEVMGLRVHAYSLEPFSGSHRLRLDDFTSRNILDDAVDGLQLEYLLDDGSMVHQPDNPAKIRAVKISLLVRSLRRDSRYFNNITYKVANHTYGPFLDHYRRCLVTSLVEVKNNAVL